jgi:hypothetical protein
MRRRRAGAASPSLSASHDRDRVAPVDRESRRVATPLRGLGDGPRGAPRTQLRAHASMCTSPYCPSASAGGGPRRGGGRGAGSLYRISFAFRVGSGDARRREPRPGRSICQRGLSAVRSRAAERPARRRQNSLVLVYKSLCVQSVCDGFFKSVRPDESACESVTVVSRRDESTRPQTSAPPHVPRPATLPATPRHSATLATADSARQCHPRRTRGRTVYRAPPRSTAPLL